MDEGGLVVVMVVVVMVVVGAGVCGVVEGCTGALVEEC